MADDLSTQLQALGTKVQALVTAYEGLLPSGQSPDPSLTSAAADVATAQTTATAVEQQAAQATTCAGQLQQLQAFLALIYQALGQPLSAQPQAVVAQVAQGVAAVRQAQQQAAVPTPPPGVPTAVAAGLALGTLAAGALGGWYAKGKMAEAKAAENPVKGLAGPPGPAMLQGHALRYAAGQWQPVLVGASVVKAAKFSGYHLMADGERVAVFKTPSGGVYAQPAAEEPEPEPQQPQRGPRVTQRKPGTYARQARKPRELAEATEETA